MRNAQQAKRMAQAVKDAKDRAEEEAKVTKARAEEAWPAVHLRPVMNTIERGMEPSSAASSITTFRASSVIVGTS